MARRSNDLTSIVGGMDRRIKILETSKVTSVPLGTYAVAPAGDENTESAPGVTAENTPWRYRKIDSAFIYGSKATRGNGTRVELFMDLDDNNDATMDFDMEVGVNQSIQISGLNGNSATDYEASGTFRLLDYDVLSQSPTRQSWRVTPPAGTTHTLFYNPVIVDNNTAAQELITKRAIDSASVSGSTITIVFNSAHKFRQGDVIYTDLPAPFFGIDGLFRITSVVSNTSIQVELENVISIPQTYTWTNPNPRRFAYAVVHRFVEEGTIWIDEAFIPNKVFVWRDIRWYDTADPIGTVAAEQDGIAPSPVTNLAATTEVPAGETTPVIDLTWTPPTTRSDGSPISGFLSGYEIRHKLFTSPTWTTTFVPDGGAGVSSYRISTGLKQNFDYNIEVYVMDIMSQRSTAATLDVLTAKYSEVLNAPAAPTVTSKLGTITVDWSGLDSTGNLPVRGVLFVEIHESTTSGFTPSDATLVESIPVSSGGNYSVLTGRLFDNTTTYYYKIVFVRQISSTELVKSDPSAESPGIKVQGVVGPDIVAGSITTNNLVAGFVTAEIVRGGSIIAQEPESTRRVEIKASGITAYSTDSPTNYSFELQSQTGNVTIVGGTLTSSTITGGTIQTTSQANTGIKMNNGGLFAYNGTSPTPTFSVDATTGAVVINGGSLTITSGLSGYIPTGGAAADINNPANTTTINGGKITTGSIDADRIGVNTLTAYLISGREIRLSAFPENDNSNPKISITKDRIAAFRLNGSTSFRLTKDGDFYGDDIFINDGTLSGTLEVTGNINGGSFSGGTFRTSLTGKRVLISSTSNSVVFFDPTGAEAGRIQGGLSGTGTFDFTGSGTASMSIGSVSTVFDGNLSTSGTSSILAAGRLGQNQFSSLGTVAAVGRFATTGFFGPTPSDLRLKENIEALADSLDIIKRLRPVKFTYKSEPDGPVNYGLIAQEVRELFDDRDHVVNEMDPADDGETYFSVEYISFVAPLIRAVQQLSDKIDDLESRLSS